MARRGGLLGLFLAGALAALGGWWLVAEGPLAPGPGPGPGTAPMPGALSLRTQDFARDPGWEARNNRRLGSCVITRQDFGLRDTADGRRALGGLITRAAKPAWYGTPVSLDFERPFEARGVLTVHRTSNEGFPSGSALVGFFNSSNRDWRAPNVLAFQLDADSVDDGDYWLRLSYGSRHYESDNIAFGSDDQPVGLRFGQPYEWRLAYDPDGAEGNGVATLAFPRVDDRIDLELDPQARRSGAVLDRFGLTNQTMARGREVELSLADLSVQGKPVLETAQWDGRGNEAVYNDCITGQPNSFGWTGDDDGRAGGLVARTDEGNPQLHASYADRVGQLDLDDRLHAEGSVELDRANSDSATLLGWFRSGTTGGDAAAAGPPDFVGVSITGPSAIGQYLAPLASGSLGELELAEKEAGIVLNPSPRARRWSFDYYPDSGAAGVVVVRVGSQRRVWSLPAEIRCEGARLDRFGLRNVEKGGSFQVVFVDDLRYTVGRSRGGPSIRSATVEAPAAGDDGARERSDRQARRECLAARGEQGGDAKRDRSGGSERGAQRREDEEDGDDEDEDEDRGRGDDEDEDEDEDNDEEDEDEDDSDDDEDSDDEDRGDSRRRGNERDRGDRKKDRRRKRDRKD